MEEIGLCSQKSTVIKQLRNYPENKLVSNLNRTANYMNVNNVLYPYHSAFSEHFIDIYIKMQYTLLIKLARRCRFAK